MLIYYTMFIKLCVLMRLYVELPQHALMFLLSIMDDL